MLATWWRDRWEAYFRNAVSVRDFRAQMRGTRVAYFWTAYLGVLILTFIISYNDLGGQTLSASMAQARLQGASSSLIGMLAWLVVLVAPGLTATSLVGERIRRSYDLLFSSPVSPTYFLVGKAIASYRYIWMLLLLTVPILAANVMVGGMTWGEVLATYVLLASHALVLVGIALIVGSTATRVVGAVVLSYLAAGAMLFVQTLFYFETYYSFRSASTGATRLVDPLAVFTPFQALELALARVPIGGWEVPAWLIAVAGSLLICKICVDAAASAISPFGSAETRKLRITGVLLAAFVGFLLAGRAMTSGGWATAAGWLGFWLATMTPHLSVYVRDGGRKYLNDGLFSLRKVFLGSPAGALPLLLVCYFVGYVVVYGFGYWAGVAMDDWLAYATYGLGLVVFMWGVSRLVSSLGMSLYHARLTVGLLALFLGLVWIIVLSTADLYSSTSPNERGWTWFKSYILWPLVTQDDPSLVLTFSVALLAVGFGGAWIGQTWERATVTAKNTSGKVGR